MAGSISLWRGWDLGSLCVRWGECASFGPNCHPGRAVTFLLYAGQWPEASPVLLLVGLSQREPRLPTVKVGTLGKRSWRWQGWATVPPGLQDTQALCACPSCQIPQGLGLLGQNQALLCLPAWHLASAAPPPRHLPLTCRLSSLLVPPPSSSLPSRHFLLTLAWPGGQALGGAGRRAAPLALPLSSFLSGAPHAPVRSPALGSRALQAGPSCRGALPGVCLWGVLCFSLSSRD